MNGSPWWWLCWCWVGLALGFWAARRSLPSGVIACPSGCPSIGFPQPPVAHSPTDRPVRIMPVKTVRHRSSPGDRLIPARTPLPQRGDRRPTLRQVHAQPRGRIAPRIALQEPRSPSSTPPHPPALHPRQVPPHRVQVHPVQAHQMPLHRVQKYRIPLQEVRVSPQRHRPQSPQKPRPRPQLWIPWPNRHKLRMCPMIIGPHPLLTP